MCEDIQKQSVRAVAHATLKNGTTAQGKQRYRGKEYGRQFLFALSYTYRACMHIYRGLVVHDIEWLWYP